MKKREQAFRFKIDVIGIGMASVSFAILLFVVVSGKLGYQEIGLAVEKTFHPEVSSESETLLVEIRDGEKWMYQKSDKSDLDRFSLEAATLLAGKIGQQEKTPTAIIMVYSGTDSGLLVQVIDDLTAAGFLSVQLAAMG